MTYVNNGAGGRPASSKDRARQTREMKDRLDRAAAEREDEGEASDLREAESQKRWAETYAALNLDNVIELPGRQGGKDVVIRYVVEKDGRLREVKDV